MFIGGLQFGTSEADKKGKLQNIPQDTAVIIFDVIDSYSVTLSNEKTSYPIESRSSVTDHVFSPDGKFSFVGRITSSPFIVRSQNEWDKSTDPENLKESNRAQKAYDVLVAARNAKQKTTIEIEEGVLTDYIITNLNIVRDSSVDQLTVSIDLEEMRTVTVGKTVLALNIGNSTDSNNPDSLKNSASGNKNKGAVSKDGPDGKGKSQPCTTLNINSDADNWYKELGYTVCDGETRYKFTKE